LRHGWRTRRRRGKRRRRSRCRMRSLSPLSTTRSGAQWRCGQQQSRQQRAARVAYRGPPQTASVPHAAGSRCPAIRRRCQHAPGTRSAACVQPPPRRRRPRAAVRRPWRTLLQPTRCPTPATSRTRPPPAARHARRPRHAPAATAGRRLPLRGRPTHRRTGIGDHRQLARRMVIATSARHAQGVVRAWGARGRRTMRRWGVRGRRQRRSARRRAPRPGGIGHRQRPRQSCLTHEGADGGAACASLRPACSLDARAWARALCGRHPSGASRRWWARMLVLHAVGCSALWIGRFACLLLACSSLPLGALPT